MKKIHHNIIVCSKCLAKNRLCVGAYVWLTFRNVVPKYVNIVVPIGSVVLMGETHGMHKFMLNCIHIKASIGVQ